MIDDPTEKALSKLSDDMRQETERRRVDPANPDEMVDGTVQESRDRRVVDKLTADPPVSHVQPPRNYLRVDSNWVEPKTAQPAVYQGERGDPGYRALLDEMWDLHLLKSGGYGTGKDPFANFTLVSQATEAPRYVYPIARMIEKMARAQSLIAQGRNDEIGEELKDIAGLALCAESMRRSDPK